MNKYQREAIKYIDMAIYGYRMGRAKSTGPQKEFYEKLIYAHRTNKRLLLKKITHA